MRVARWRVAGHERAIDHRGLMMATIRLELIERRATGRPPPYGAMHEYEHVQSGMSAVLAFSDSLEPMKREVRVTFDNAKNTAYAQAEAARLLAQVFDTIGDLSAEVSAHDDGLALSVPTLMESTVIVTGPDSPFVVAPYFGGDFATDNATDRIMDLIQGK